MRKDQKNTISREMRNKLQDQYSKMCSVHFSTALSRQRETFSKSTAKKGLPVKPQLTSLRKTCTGAKITNTAVLERNGPHASRKS